MRAARTVLAGLAVCLLAAPAARAELPELAGTTVIEADAPAVIDVRVPESFDAFPEQDSERPVAQFDGGAIIVADLHNLASPPDAFLGPDRLEFFRMGRAGAQMTGMNFRRNAESSVVPVGTYRLYLLVTEPSRVTLSLPALSGRTVIRPRRPTRFVGGFFPSIPPLTPGTTIFGRREALTGPGEMRVVYAFEPVADATVDRLEICTYDADGPTPSHAYQPGCPDGHSFAETYTRWNDQLLMVVTWGGWGAGDVGLGVNLSRPGSPRSGFVVGYWHTPDDKAPTIDDSASPGSQSATPPPSDHSSAPARAPLGPGPQRYGIATPRRTAWLHGRRVAIRLRCSSEGPCGGRAMLRGVSKVARYALPAGRSATLRLPAPARVIHQIRRRGEAGATLLVRSRAAGGDTVLRHRIAIRRR